MVRSQDSTGCFHDALCVCPKCTEEGKQRRFENVYNAIFTETELAARVAVLDEIVDRLRGQLQNCICHLEGARRKSYGRTNYDDCIESANRALYETLGR